MAFMLLLSSTGFSIDLHFCQGNIKSFSLFGTAESCHAKAKKSHCSKNKMTCHFAKKAGDQAANKETNCCSNKRVEVSPDTDTQKVIAEQLTEQKIIAEQLTETEITFISAFVAVFCIGEIFDLAKLIIPHLNYIPPLLDKDIPVLIQSFLL